MTNIVKTASEVGDGTIVTLNAGDELVIVAGVTIVSREEVGVQGQDNDTIIVDGYVFGGLNGIAGITNGSITIGKSGTVTALSSTAIYLNGSDAIENAGSIENGILANGGSYAIDNSGSILGASPTAFDIPGSALVIESGGNEVTNSGTIASSGTALIIGGTQNSIGNSGTISGSRAGILFNHTDPGSPVLNLVSNTGTILTGSGHAAITGNDNPLFVENTGKIVGYIVFGAGSDTYDGRDGAIDDKVRGGSGDDQMLGGAAADTFFGDNGNDTLKGGAGDDLLYGGGGADTMTGGSGEDTFRYISGNSTGATHDVVWHFAVGEDLFLITGVTGTNKAVSTGALTNKHFDSDLATAVGADHLGAHHALLFTPSSGGLKGHTFLVVDANGIAGYQASDYVIELKAAIGLDHFNLDCFTNG